jgi:hypothetical protein
MSNKQTCRNCDQLEREIQYLKERHEREIQYLKEQNDYLEKNNKKYRDQMFEIAKGPQIIETTYTNNVGDDDQDDEEFFGQFVSDPRILKFFKS